MFFHADDTVPVEQTIQVGSLICYGNQRHSLNFMVFMVNLFDYWFLGDSPPALEYLLEYSVDVGRCGAVEIGKPGF